MRVCLYEGVSVCGCVCMWVCLYEGVSVCGCVCMRVCLYRKGLGGQGSWCKREDEGKESKRTCSDSIG